MTMQCTVRAYSVAVSPAFSKSTQINVKLQRANKTHDQKVCGCFASGRFSTTRSNFAANVPVFFFRYYVSVSPKIASHTSDCHTSVMTGNPEKKLTGFYIAHGKGLHYVASRIG